MPRRLRTRWPGACATCATPIAAGTEAWWDRATRTLTCDRCGPAADRPLGTPDAPQAAPEVGVAGRSAQRELERRRARRERRIRAEHPILGGLILAVTEEPISTRAWARGADGERRLGARLDGLTDRGCVVLHDRRIPGAKANIDHLVVAPSGVWVVDAKRYTGRVAKRDVGGWFRTDARLYVGRRDCTRLVGGMARQVAAVERALGPDRADVAIHPVLCFVGAEWGWFATPFRLDGVLVAWPGATVEAVSRPGPLDAARVAMLGQRLAASLRPA